MFYRMGMSSGAVLLVSGCVWADGGLLCSGLCFVLVLTCGVYVSCWFDVRCYIIYYIIIYYTIILYYYILYIIYYILYIYLFILFLWSIFFYSSLPISTIPLPFPSPLQSSSDLFLSFPTLLFLSIPNIQSIRVGIWISLFILSSNNLPKVLTPHKLTEWMVEVWCGD